MVRISSKIIKILREGGVGVLPTDTLYGLVGSALSPQAVKKIYRLKKRRKDKPFIILIARLADLDLFGAQKDITAQLKKFWPGPVSIILPCPSLNKKMFYLRSLEKTLAFRLPKPYWLRRLLQKTGPLVAPSANWEGEPPSQNILQAKKYFGSKVDFYVNGGRLTGKPSTLIKIENGKIIVLRQGKSFVHKKAPRC